MKIQILGSGCAKCRQLEENARLAVAKAGIEAEVEKVTDIDQIVSFGVMMTPALVIDGQVKTVGKILTVDQIGKLLSEQP